MPLAPLFARRWLLWTLGAVLILLFVLVEGMLVRSYSSTERTTLEFRRTTELDFRTLDGLARESMTVHEPFLKRKMTFTGVRLGALLQRAGIAASTRGIYMHALDDYHVELPFAELRRDALLATRAGGRPIPIADGGPVRVIYPDGSELGAITDNWIWSVDSMAAR